MDLVLVGLFVVGAAVSGGAALGVNAPRKWYLRQPLLGPFCTVTFVVLAAVLVAWRVGVPDGLALVVLLFSLGVVLVVAVSGRRGRRIQGVVMCALHLLALGLVWQVRLTAGASKGEGGLTRSAIVIGAGIALMGLCGGVRQDWAGRLLLRVPPVVPGLAGMVLTALPLLTGTRVNHAFVTVNAPVVGSLQPGELGRVLLIVWLARSVSLRRRQLVGSRSRFFLPDLKLLWATTMPVTMGVLTAVVSNDLGPALVLAGVTAVVIFTSGVGLRYVLWAALGTGATVALLALTIGKVASRFLVMLHPLSGTEGLSQVGTGLVLLAHGGTGLGQGLPTLVPQAQNDMLVAAVGHELGSAVLLAMLALFAVLAVAGWRLISTQADDRLQLAMVGLLMSLLAQVLVVTAGVLAVAPLTGMPVPFVSLSGSNLVASSLTLVTLCALSPPGQPAVRQVISSRALTATVTVAGLLVAGLGGRVVQLWASSAETLQVAGSRDQFATRAGAVRLGAVVTSDQVVVAETAVATGQRLRLATARRVYPAGDAYAALLGNVSRPGLQARLEVSQPCGDLVAGVSATCPSTVLTLDSRVQRVAWDLMQGKTGAVVAVDIRNGDVLAYVSTQSGVAVDPLDRVRSERAAPGSIAKVATAASAVQHGLAMTSGPAAGFTPTGGQTIWATNHLPCGGSLGVAMAVSCNPYFAQLGQRLGPRLSQDSASMLNQQRGLDGLAVAESTLVAPNASGSSWSAAAGAVGLGDAQVTPVGMAELVAQIARGGSPVCFHVVRGPSAVGCSDQLTMAASTAQQVRDAMRRVVTDGTATQVAGLAGLQAAAKTGTADVTDTRTNATFVTFAPVASPRVAVVVFVEPSGPNGSFLVGGRDAGPVAAAVLRTALALQTTQ